jgi:hypothetical protein
MRRRIRSPKAHDVRSGADGQRYNTPLEAAPWGFMPALLMVTRICRFRKYVFMERLRAFFVAIPCG